jgi:hypothetical protein
MSLDIDLAPLWTSIENFFPTFFGILAIPAGIGVAIALAGFLIDKVRNAFK